MQSKIIIAKPCHENWNKMTPEEQGRHCGACNKVVQDFSKMNTEDIIESLKKSKDEVCGRISMNKLTPANPKQKIWFWLNSFVMRKAIYPVMALLGVTLVAKKSVAQTIDVQVKGKMDMRSYHSNDKKLNIVVKTSNGNLPIENAGIRIISGVTNEPTGMITDSQGKTTFTISSNHLGSDGIEIEISAPGYETKISKIHIIKDVQTVEIRMEEEIMMMGEMAYYPVDPIEKAVIDTVPVTQIEVCKCDLPDIKKLPLFVEQVNAIEEPIIEEPFIDTVSIIEKTDINKLEPTGFNLYPNPSTDFVVIESFNNDEIFNVDVFDANGKKIHSIINSQQRYTLDLSRYAAGTYYAIIMVEGKVADTKKIIVTR